MRFMISIIVGIICMIVVPPLIKYFSTVHYNSTDQIYELDLEWDHVDGAENYRVVRMDLENEKEIITVIWDACDTGECWKRNVKLIVSLENNIGFNIECLVDGHWIQRPGRFKNYPS